MGLNIIKMISKYNFYAGNINRIKYIVIHYTGCVAPAVNFCNNWLKRNVGASAHYVVDYNGDIYQSVEDKNSAWHCGGTSYKHKECRNSNSIGIELCCRTTGDPTKVNANWYFEDATIEAAISLVKELMRKYNVPADHVIRHYDVTGKICPAPYYYNNGKHTWSQFQSAISDSLLKNQDSTLKVYTDKDMWNDIKAAGFPDVAVAAWLGNIKAESGLRSNNLQNTYEASLGMNDNEYTVKIDNGTYTKEKFINDKAGYGLCQWTYHSRKKMMYEYIIENKKKSIGDKAAQVSFLLYELSINYAGLVAELKTCTTVRQASDLILTKFERPKDQSEKMKETRTSYAQEYYNLYGNLGDSTISKNQYTVPFIVKVSISDLNIRKGPGTNYSKLNKYTGVGTFTIVEVQPGKGSDIGWGLLKSYQKNRDGWISLDFAKKV